MVPFKVAIIVMMIGSSLPPVQLENINTTVNLSAPAVIDIKKALIDKGLAPVSLEEGLMEAAPVTAEQAREVAVVENDQDAATVDDVVKDKTTPEAVCGWINKKVSYTTEARTGKTSSHWQTSEETLNLRTADCKGFAILVYECLKRMDLEDVKMVALTNRRYGHVVVIFKKDGKWRMVSNGKLYSYLVDDYKDLFKIFVGIGNYQFCTPQDHNIMRI